MNHYYCVGVFISPVGAAWARDGWRLTPSIFDYRAFSPLPLPASSMGA